LPKSILRRLNSAQGWLNLGDWEEAAAELDGIDSEFQSIPLILIFRVEIYRMAENWGKMAEISRHLCGAQPAEAGHWLNYSYGARRSESVEAARDILTRAKKLFRNNAMIWFNLACYHAQLGELNEARVHVAEAMRIQPDFRETALKDPDLEALWPELRGESD